MGDEPRTTRGRAVKARIVATAAELMYRGGVAATSVDDVLAASGTGKGQFYHYFADKRHLVEAVLRHQLDRVLAEQRRFDIGTWDGVRGWLESLLVTQMERGFYGGCPLGSVVAEVADQDERLRTVAVEAFSRWEAELAAGLKALQNRRELAADVDAERLAEEALATIQGGYLLSMSKKDIRPLRNALEAAFARLASYSC